MVYFINYGCVQIAFNESVEFFFSFYYTGKSNLHQVSVNE